MKKILRLMSVILTITVLLSVVSTATPVLAAEVQTASAEASLHTEAETEDSDTESAAGSEAVHILGEDKSRRDENTKHFIMSDGSRKAVIYSEPVHYRENGEWTDIDNTLEYDTKNKEYKNKQNSFDVKFKDNFRNDDFFTIENQGYTLSWEYSKNSLSKLFVNGEVAEIAEPKDRDEKHTHKPNGKITYNNFESNCELEYVVTSTGVKENIILNQKTDKNEFSFKVTADGLTLVKNADGSISAKTAEDEEIFYIPAPFMYDSKKAYSDKVSYVLKENNDGTYAVTVTADKEWLNATEREYPVTIDPVISTKRSREDIDSTFIASATPNTNYYENNHLSIGWESSQYGRTRTLIKFNLPTLNKGDMVVGASLNLVTWNESAYTSTMPEQQIDAHLIESAWSAETVTWNTSLSIGSTILDYDYLNADGESEWHQFDITRAVKGWHEGTITNHGIMLKQNVENGTYAENCANAWYWTEKYNNEYDYYPVISIEYRNNKGVEDYWSYSSYGIDTAGSAYINDYTGNLVYSMPILSSVSEIMPLTLSAVFNNYCATQMLTAGKEKSSRTTPGRGFRLNIQETVLPSTLYGLSETEAENYPYVYADGDGTEHYFQKVTEKDDNGNETTVYKDEDGLGLTLEINGDCKYKIKDKSDTEYWFNVKGNLVKIMDANGNSTDIYYKAANASIGLEEKSRISHITDGAGHKYTFEYYIVDGVESDYIKTITDNAGRVVTFTTKGGHIRKVTYPDGTITRFVYEFEDSTTENVYEEAEEGLINYILSNDGYGLNFDYSAKATGRRIKAVKELGTDKDTDALTTGQIVTFDRTEYNTTVVRTPGIDGYHQVENEAKGDDDIITTLQFDNSGRTVSQQIKYGSGSFVGAGSYDYTSGAGDTTTMGSKNRVSATGASGKTVLNLLTGGNAESTTGWTHSASAPSAVTAQKYMGKKALELSNTGLTGSGISYYRQRVDGLTNGSTYTLSAYVKVGEVTKTADNNYTGAHLQITTVGTDGDADDPVRSEAIFETTDTGIDNGWRRITATVTIPDDEAYTYIYLCLRNMNGTVWFDCIQLEAGQSANTYNMLENSSFEKASNGLPTGWTPINTSYSVASSGTVTNGISTLAKANGSQSVRITGEADVAKGYKQLVYVEGNPNDTYIVSGWAKGYPVNSTFHTDGTDDKGTTDKGDDEPIPTALFEIAIKVTYSCNDGKGNVTDVAEYKEPAKFNTTVNSWQYSSTPFVLQYREPKDGCTYTPKYVEIVPRYCKQVNHVYFDHLMLVKEPTQTYSYDKDGNLVSAAANSEQKANIKYDDNDNIKSYTDSLNNTTKMNYDDNHNLINSASPRGIKTENTNNSKGMTTATEVHNKSLYSNSEEDGYVAPTMSLRTTRAFYEEDTTTAVKESAFVQVDYDEHRYGTYYTYDYNTGVTETITDAKNTVTTYGYDSDKTRMESVSASNSSVSYGYNGNRLSSIVFGSGTYTEEYGFDYDEYGNVEKTLVGGSALSTNTYEDNNSVLLLTEFGNKDKIRYEYTNLGNKNRVFYNDSENEAYYWRYDASGTPVLHQDNQNDRRYRYGYDSLGRLYRMEIRADNSDEFLGFVEQGYDLSNNVNKLVTNLGGRTNTQRYFYVENSLNSNSASYSKDGLASTYVFSGNRYATYDYDSLNRLTQRKFSTATPLYNNYTYKLSANRNTDGGNLYRTTQINTEFIANDTYTYTYDELGNITSVRKGTRTSTDPTNAGFTTVTGAVDYRSYEYDALGQLTRENNATDSRTSVWTYDRLGNVQTKTDYGHTTAETISGARTRYIDYQYGADTNAGFNKLLRHIDIYNGTDENKSTRYVISYDAIGNPIKYDKTTYNAETGVSNDDTTTVANMNWRGRQLMSLVDNTNSRTITYLYDADGLRGSKTVNNAKTTYTYVGDKLCYQHTANTDGSTNYELYFFYDSTGALSVIQYYVHSGETVTGYTYYVMCNSSGDVLGLYDGDGVLRVSYEYDAWGNVLSVKDANENEITNPNSIAHRNPIRYRGYYYDVETGLYYLQSRYYNPEIGRFLNADNQISGIGGSTLGHNVFSYCYNSPVNMSDPSGHWPKWVSGLLDIASGFAQMSLGAALGATVGWTGVGAVAAGLLMVNGAATATQGIGKVVNAVAQKNVLREDNMIRTSVQSVGSAIAGDTGASIAGTMYDAAVMAADMYAGGVTRNIISCCFIAGTIVLTASGNKNIEKIEAGDLVWSENPETNVKALKQVVQTFVRESYELVHVFVNGEEIVTTPEHPFYVAKKGWVESLQLRAGDILVLRNGEYVTVEKIQHEILETPVTVYNFEVEDFHTYYVGNCSVLVHNECGPNLKPENFIKMRGNQGYKDKKGNFWNVDKLHKDHYDVINSKGKKIKEVDFDGIIIWPDGAKNKNKR